MPKSKNLKPGINGPHGQHDGRTDDWLTPLPILHALGIFDLDPCAAPSPRPWPTAKVMWTKKDDGFSKSWTSVSGPHMGELCRVWLNPPYGVETGKWVQRLADHGNGVALVFARTDTRFWHDVVVKRAEAILFLDGRLTFCRPDGRPASANSGGPSALIAFGRDNVRVLRESGLHGHFVKIRPGDQQ